MELFELDMPSLRTTGTFLFCRSVANTELRPRNGIIVVSCFVLLVLFARLLCFSCLVSFWFLLGFVLVVFVWPSGLFFVVFLWLCPDLLSSLRVLLGVFVRPSRHQVVSQDFWAFPFSD